MKRKHFLGALGASALALVGAGKAISGKRSEERRMAGTVGLPEVQADPRSVARSSRG